MSKSNLHGARSRRLHLSALLAVLLCVPPLLADGLAKADTPWHRWKSIRLRVKSMPFVSGRVWMHLTPAEKEVRLATETTARFLGARVATTRTESVMDPQTGLPRSYISHNPKRARRFTFDDEGYLFEKLGPAPKKGATHERTVRGSQRFAYPVDADGKRLPVYDHYGMLLFLRGTDLAKVGDELVVHVATSRGPIPYRIRVAEVRAAEMRYVALPDKKRRNTVVREMRLQVIPDDPESEEGFLNMKGETELWVEARSKTVLRIGGKAPKVGKITLILAEMG